MKLTTNDYENIAQKIENGKGHVEYEKDDELMVIDYELEEDGYIEDDYYNGTGAFVRTNRYFTATATSCAENGKETENNFNEYELLNMIA